MVSLKSTLTNMMDLQNDCTTMTMQEEYELVGAGLGF